MSADLRQRSQTTCLREPHIHGRDEAIKQIMELLLGDAPTGSFFDVIPIVGMGGIGKTTLAQHIYNDNRVEKHFNLKAWACVSDDFEVMRITKAILESFTHGSCNFSNLNEVQVQLSKTLAGKTFLLVLDDVWDYGRDGWNLLRSPFGAGAPGSKIIVTTRDRGVAKQMGMDKYHNLHNLSHDDCWLIFAQHAFGNRNIMECPKLVPIGKKIVENRCRGLPLATRALGSLLCCKQEEHEWKEILNSNIWNEESVMLTTLKLSYLHLPVHLKRSFSYCAIIPKDYEFMKEELVLLWMAEGLIEKPNGGDQMEDLGCKYFHELVSRSFFQPSSGNKLQFIMHDLINDLAQDVAGNKCFRLENNLEGGRQNKISDKAHHAAYVASCYDGIKKFKAFDDAKCLRTFLEFLPQQFHFVTKYLMHDLLPKLKCLPELRLCSIGINELPDSNGDLKHLWYLDLSNSRITRLPDTVVTLYNLQVLLLKYCRKLQKLPLNVESLVNLRHFDMTGVHIPSSEEMPLHIGKLTNLQTSSNFIVGKACGRKIGELKNLSHIRGAIHISKLENLNGVKDARDANLTSKELKELSLELDESRNVSFSKMVFMRLKGSKCCTSLPPLGQLTLLKDLYIEGMSAIKRLGCEFSGRQCGNKPFLSLERLSFEFIPEWEDWSAFETEGVQSFGHLMNNILVMLQSLCNPSTTDAELLANEMSKHLTSIIALSISHVEKLAFLPTWFTRDLMGLKKLSISNCQELITLWWNKVRIQVCLPSLCHLEIFDCPKLVCLFEEEQEKEGEGSKKQQHEGLPCMTRLEYLTIQECGMLKKLPQDLHTYTSLGVLRIFSCASLISFPMKGLPSRLRELSVSTCNALESLPELMTLNNLLELQVSSCESLTYLLSRGGLPSTLKKLQIRSCAKLESLFAEEGIKIDCPSLETIHIEFCGRLKSLPEANNLRNLSELWITGCPNLERRSLGGRDENKNVNQLTLLQMLVLVDCRAGMVSYFVKEGSFPTNITSLEIRNLRGDDVGQLPLPPPSPLEWGLHKLSSLTTLQLEGPDWPWGDTVSFPEEGMFLPTSLINLTITRFLNLERLSYEE
ncbi:unnamed protein product [Camellia sinensis]